MFLELTERLNAMGGALKSVDKWKKTWRDLKSNVKRKAGKTRQSISDTGGDPAADVSTLTDLEQKVLAVLGSEAVYRIPGVQETVVIIESLDASETFEIEVPTSGSDVLPTIQSASQVLPEESSQSSVNYSNRPDTPQPKRVVTGKTKRRKNIEYVFEGILKLKKERLELKRLKLQLDREAFEENKKYKQQKLDVLKRIAAALDGPS
ncbi:unnamed protein product [Arctia plantaginis]|uniref:Regulatory protein zeste n=1 Tax=Arctia plantaginis TaxID=874455 RepID=A0A8S1AH36_ARCPL|nr:unnamed protein product [Arctia plantaginis]